MTIAKKASCAAIMVNFNHSAFLPQALDAVLNQSVPFDEIIIVDDGSSDDSVSIITHRIAGLPNARLIRNATNMGVIPSVNTGIKAATADFLFFMSVDDYYSNQIIEWCQNALAHYPDVAMVSGNTRICNIDNGSQRVFVLPFPQKMECYSRDALEALAQKRVITFYGGANIIRRDAVISAGNYLEELKWHADWFLYLLVACRYRFVAIPHEFIRIRQTSTQYSHACYDWKKQKQVITAFIRILQENYPAEYEFFRTGALLPTYDIQTLFLLFANKPLRRYLTPLLVWRLLTYKPMRAMGRLLPDKLRLTLRKWLRV